MKRFSSVLPLLAFFLGSVARADVDKSLRDLVETRNYSRGNPTHLEFTPDGQKLLFLRSGPRDDQRALFEFSLADGTTRQLLTALQVVGQTNEVLSAAEKARRERMRLTASGIADFRLSKDGKSLLIPLANRWYTLNRSTGEVQVLPESDGAIDARWSPDARRVAYVVGNDLLVADVANGQRHPITQGGTELISYGQAEFVAQEEMARMRGYWWAPDGKSLLVERADARGVETWRVADPMHPDRTSEPQFYPRPGHSNVVVDLGLFSISGGKPTWLQWDRQRLPYVVEVDWSEKGGLTVQAMSRDQKDLILLKADPKTGHTVPLISVHDEAWVNFVPGLVQWLEDGSGFIWATENERAWQIELRGPNGGLKRKLVSETIGSHFGERSRPTLDAPSGQVLFSAGLDPTRHEVWQVNARLNAPVPLLVRLDHATDGASGLIGPKGFYAIFSSGPLEPPVCTVYRADGTAVGVVPSVAERPTTWPKVEFTHVGDGLGYYVKIVRPRDFNPNKRYPVIASVYGGPTAAVVGRGFGGFMDQWIADHGFIVASADGKGTPGRGRSWERAITNRFAEIPLEEQIAALKAMGARYPEMDLDRVGITGWSFGGYLSAIAALRRPDFFKAAVAGAPVTDWLDYDTCYTERYLGVPGAGDTVYGRNSLIADAKSLKCPLLLIHGTTDDNVFFRHTLKLADALFRNGQPFEFLPLSGFTHMVPDPAVREQLELRMVTFFQAHLGGPR